MADHPGRQLGGAHVRCPPHRPVETLATPNLTARSAVNEISTFRERGYVSTLLTIPVRFWSGATRRVGELKMTALLALQPVITPIDPQSEQIGPPGLAEAISSLAGRWVI